jgi:hypothetical protein
MQDTKTLHIEEIRKCSINPKYFARKYIKYVDGTGVSSDVERIVADINISDRLIGRGSRGIGLTSGIAVHALWMATFKNDMRLLIVSRTLQQAIYILSLIKQMRCMLPQELTHDVVYNSQKELSFSNGSKIIVHVAGRHTGKGMMLNHIYIDEFAHISYDIQCEMLTSLMPCVGSQLGKVALLSSVSCNKNLFQMLFEQDNNFRKCTYKGFYKTNFEHYAQLRQMMTEAQWKREMCCEFIQEE